MRSSKQTGDIDTASKCATDVADLGNARCMAAGQRSFNTNVSYGSPRESPWVWRVRRKGCGWSMTREKHSARRSEEKFRWVIKLLSCVSFHILSSEGHRGREHGLEAVKAPFDPFWEFESEGS